MHNRLHVYGLLFAVSIVTAGGSILYLSHVANGSPTEVAKNYPATTSNDAYQYAQLAKNLVEYGSFSMSTSSPLVPDTFRTPGYPLFAAALYKLFGTFYAVLIAQVFLVFLTALLIFKIAGRFMSQGWALAAAIIYLLDPDTMLWASLTMTDTLFALAFTAFFYVVFFAEIKNLYLRWLLAGIVLAAAVYVRPVAIYVPIILLPAYAWFFRAQIRMAARTYLTAGVIFVVVFLALLAPWYVRNHDVSGAWGFASIGSYDLFNHYVPYFLNSVYGTDVGETKNMLEAQVGMPVGVPVSTDLKYADAMQSTALHIMLADPTHYAKYHLSFLPAFFLSPASHEYWRVYNDLLPNSTVAPEPSLAQALNPFSLSLLITVLNNHGWFLLENALWASVLALALIGLWRAPMLRRFIGMVLCLTLYFALVTGPLSHARYRMPVDGLLIVTALATLALLWDGDISLRVSSRRSASRDE